MHAIVPDSIQLVAEQRFIQWQERLDDPTISTNNEFIIKAKYLLSVSDYAFEWLMKKPQWLLEINTCATKSFAELKQEIQQLSIKKVADLSEFEIKQWLRHQRHFWSIAIASMDLSNDLTIREVTFLQALLANELINSAKNWLEVQFKQQYGVSLDSSNEPQELVIMAMGKLGGMELNFSSDIDLIFCYPEDGETSPAINPNKNSDNQKPSQIRTIDNQKYFTRLGQKLVALLHETNADGFVYRVDMRLRPYGQSGALTMNFDSIANYYLEQGREWERFALIKTKVLANNKTYSKSLSKVIKPFSYRRYIDFSVLDSIRQLKQKISTEMRNLNLASDIKLGHGGIREIEFIVQSYQLINGGRFPALQTSNWWESLAELISSDLIPEKAANNLKNAYEFLRRLENRLQIRSNAQTQQLPIEEFEQSIIAHSMGFDSWQLMLETLNQYRDWVEQFFKQLFQDPNEQIQSNDTYQEIERLIKLNELKSSDKEFLESKRINVDLIKQVQQFKKQFITNKLGARGRKRVVELLPHLIILTSKQKNPTESMQRCLSLLESIGRRSAYFELLAENIPILEHLVNLSARSSWLVDQLCLYPSLLDELLFPSNFGKILSKEDFSSQLQQLLLRIEPEQIEEQLLAIGRFRVSSQFKVAAGMLNHRFDIKDVCRQLTDIAEIILQELLNIAWRELVQKHGVPQGLANEADTESVKDFVILGYGKLGGHELGFGSDLDLVFLYQNQSNGLTTGKKPIENPQFYTRLGQRLVHYLNARTQHGTLYEVDTRLRPSGRSGLLVSEIESFKNYQRNEAWTWEIQALVRARPVAGDSALMLKYEQSRLQLMAKPSKLASEIVSMRYKMRTNLDKSDDQLWDVKQGKGGIIDIEFLVQYWVLDSAQNNKNLPNQYSNQYWLNWLQQEKIISDENYEVLAMTYQLYQNVANHKKLQNKGAFLAKDELKDARQSISSIWDSTFAEVELQ